ncbi:MAG: T9SS type A sorting domain-containing protein, partial [Bacteroidetes bacterium]|nr:T9SS type A sorting domain-containing protein [Bacteroidota bacterium]
LKLGPGTVFNQSFSATSPRLFFNGATFNQNGMIEKTGAGDDASIGGNFFASSSWLQIKNSGTGNLIFGTVNPDVFSGSTEIYNNSPAAEIRIADGSFGNIISGNVTFDNGTSAAPSSRSIHICNTGSLSVSGAIRLNNFGSAGIFFGENGGNTTFTNSSNIGSFGFVDGTLQWSNVTSDQVNNIWYMAGTASLKLGPGTVFNQSFSATSPSLFLNGATFNSINLLEKNGTVNDISDGNNIFNTAADIRNSGTGSLLLANLTTDTYNNSISLTNLSTGNIDLAYTQDISVKNNMILNLANPITSGTNGGSVVFDGTGLQTITKTGSSNPIFNRLKMNKSVGALNLNSPISIGIQLNFTNGIINSSATNFCNFNDNSGHLNVSNTSHVNGPVSKTGNDAFIYPVGKSGKYQPIAISAPSLVTDVFTGEYFFANSNGLYPHSSKVASLVALSFCDYWILDRTLGTSNVNVSLSWNNNNCGGVASLTNIGVARWSSLLSQWQDHGNGGTTGTTSNGTVTTSAAVTSFSPFALSSHLGPLPIELLSFNAKLNSHNTVDLNWSTASETNNDFFTVEKTIDGNEFYEVGKIDGAGNSNSILNYSTLDETPFEGLSYYRLKQTDFDGKFSYSELAPIILNSSNEFTFNIFPNPFNGTDINLEITGKIGQIIKISFTDILGREIISKSQILDNNGNNILKFVPEIQLEAGVYFVNVYSDEIRISKPLLVK